MRQHKGRYRRVNKCGLFPGDLSFFLQNLPKGTNRGTYVARAVRCRTKSSRRNIATNSMRQNKGQRNVTADQ